MSHTQADTGFQESKSTQSQSAHVILHTSLTCTSHLTIMIINDNHILIYVVIRLPAEANVTRRAEFNGEIPHKQASTRIDPAGGIVVLDRAVLTPPLTGATEVL